jgi:hypothetical protein
MANVKRSIIVDSHQASRTRLPRPCDRLPIGQSGLSVSPLCLGMTSAETVISGYEAGINFFFLTADAHWPYYEGMRAGLAKLLSGSKSRRTEIVVAVVSYLDEPFFHQAGQFEEAVDAVPGLGHADVLIAGATTGRNLDRIESLSKFKESGYCGSRVIGASFHHRPSAVAMANAGRIDLAYIRYNTDYTGARVDLLPHLAANRENLVFNFKSIVFPVTPEEFLLLPPSDRRWLPEISDYYRFCLSHPGIDGILCSPSSPSQLEALVQTLHKEPLDLDGQEYMIRLAALAHPPKSLPRRMGAWWDHPVETPARPVG